MSDTPYYRVHYEDESLDINDFVQVQASDAEAARQQFEQRDGDKDTTQSITNVKEAFTVNHEEVSELLGDDEIEFE